MAQFEVYFDSIFPSENSRNLHLLHKNNAIVAKPLLGSSGVVGRERMGTAFPHKKLSGNGVPTREILRFYCYCY